MTNNVTILLLTLTCVLLSASMIYINLALRIQSRAVKLTNRRIDLIVEQLAREGLQQLVEDARDLEKEVAQQAALMRSPK